MTAGRVPPIPPIGNAQVVLPAADLRATLSFFVDALGFRVESIQPADRPSTAVLFGHGLTIRLERDLDGSPGVLRVVSEDPHAIAGGATELVAPNGTRVLLAPARLPIVSPRLRPSFVHSKLRDAAWVEGRAEMRYRDLIPDRQGGRFVASHIQIPRGGPVPDYVHFHRVTFLMIYCARGWVRVVYED